MFQCHGHLFCFDSLSVSLCLERVRGAAGTRHDLAEKLRCAEGKTSVDCSITLSQALNKSQTSLVLCMCASLGSHGEMELSHVRTSPALVIHSPNENPHRRSLLQTQPLITSATFCPSEDHSNYACYLPGSTHDSSFLIGSPLTPSL